MSLEIALLLVNAMSTWFMTGVIWFVQVVHYPLLSAVGSAEFRRYADQHRQSTTTIVAPPMLIEIATSLLLAITWSRANVWLLWLNFLFVVIVWISTALCSIPCHEKLCTTGYIKNVHHWLVLSNWLRTVMWNLRALVLAYFIYSTMSKN